MKRIAVIGAGIAVAIAAYFLITPLFVSTEVNEPSPLAVEEYRKFVSMKEEDMMLAAAQMSEEEKEMVMVELHRPVRK
jgi:hypothetical protein